MTARPSTRHRTKTQSAAPAVDWRSLLRELAESKDSRLRDLDENYSESGIKNRRRPPRAALPSSVITCRPYRVPPCA